MHRFASWLAGFVIVLLSGAVVAQTGGIAGSVSDRTGAFLQDVQITARNLSTNAVRIVTSSDVGSYSIPNLPLRNYEVTFERSGFKILKYFPVVITVVVPLHAELTISSTAETVEVKCLIESPVQGESSQVSNIVDTRRMIDLPLLTRNPYELVLLSPGAIQSNTRLGGFSVNGSRERNNNFLLDGTDNNDTSVPGGAGGIISLNPEATQEFRVITNNFQPEFGRNGGAIVDIVTKSGGNEFRGDAYWFGRYYGFGRTRDCFNRSPDPQNPYGRNQFGFSFGGPIWKDKTFFFVNNEFQRFRTTLTNSSIVPTSDFKSGVFTYTDPVNGPVDVNLADPESPSNLTGLGLDSTAQQILALYPAANGPVIDKTRAYFFFPSRSAQNVYNLTTRLDHRFTENHNIAVRYAYNYFSDPNPFHSEFLPPCYTIPSRQRFQRHFSRSDYHLQKEGLLMSSTGKSWPELYRQALLESDRSRLPARMEEAHKAIQRRARELWYAGSPESRERHDLDAALRFLGLLRTVASSGDAAHSP